MIKKLSKSSTKVAGKSELHVRCTRLG